MSRQSIINLATAKEQSLKVLYDAICIHNFTPSEDDELAMEYGSKIKVLKNNPDDPNWVEAFNVATKKFGFVPLNHIKKMQGIKTSSENLRKSVIFNSLSNNANSNAKSGTVDIRRSVKQIDADVDRDFVALTSPKIFEALYRYEGEQDDELSFEKGDLLVALGRSESDDDWFYGFKYVDYVAPKRRAFSQEFVKPSDKRLSKPLASSLDPHRRSVAVRASKMFTGGINLGDSQKKTQKFMPPKLFEVIFDYQAEDDDELTLKVGQIVEAYEDSVDEGWYLGVIRNSPSALQHFPLACCKAHSEPFRASSELNQYDNKTNKNNNANLNNKNNDATNANKTKAYQNVRPAIEENEDIYINPGSYSNQKPSTPSYGFGSSPTKSNQYTNNNNNKNINNNNNNVKNPSNLLPLAIDDEFDKINIVSPSNISSGASPLTKKQYPSTTSSKSGSFLSSSPTPQSAAFADKKQVTSSMNNAEVLNSTVSLLESRMNIMESSFQAMKQLLKDQEEVINGVQNTNRQLNQQLQKITSDYQMMADRNTKIQNTLENYRAAQDKLQKIVENLGITTADPDHVMNVQNIPIIQQDLLEIRENLDALVDNFATYKTSFDIVNTRVYKLKNTLLNHMQNTEPAGCQAQTDKLPRQ